MALIRTVSRGGAFWSSLHGLRGIAALVVVLSHLGKYDLELGLIPHAHIGKTGVWIFFALSAFLLTYRLTEAVRSSGAWASPLLAYTAHRIFRIYPLLVVVVAVHWLVDGLSAREAWLHLALLGSQHGIWAIPVEFAFYAALPVLVAVVILGGSRLAIGLLVGLTIGAVLGVPGNRVFFSGDLALYPKIAPFAVGAIAGLLHLEGRLLVPRVERWLPLAGAAGAIGLIVTAALSRSQALGATSVSVMPELSLAMGAATVALITASLRSGIASRILSSRPLVFLGEVSFSLYLTHIFVIHFAAASAPGSHLMAWSALIFSVPLAWVCYILIERPGMRAGRLLGDWISGERVLGAPLHLPDHPPRVLDRLA